MAIYVDNAIFWAQLRIHGGWRHLLSIALIYAAVAIFCIAMFHSLALDTGVKRYVLSFSSMMVLIVQTVMMSLLASGAIAGAIRRDINNHQIESNRLMPLSPAQAIVGYIAGAAAHIIALCIVNFLIGAGLAELQGLPISDWISINLLLFLFCLSIWTAMAMAAFISRATFGLLFGICFGIAFSGGLVFLVAPGLLAFSTPMHGRTIFQTTSQPRLTAEAVVGLVAQFLLAVLWIRGAARKYHKPDAQSITLGPALATLGIWAGLSWFGLTEFVQMRPVHLMQASVDWRVITVGAIASCLLVSLLSLGAVAWSSITREQHRRAGDDAPARPWIFWLCLPVCILFAISPLSASINDALVTPYYYGNSVGQNLPVLSYGKNPNIVMIICAVAVFLIQSYLLMRILYPRLRRPNILLFIIIVLTWFVPLAADIAYSALKDPDHGPRMDHFALLSPLGTIAQALDNPVPRTWPGLAAQGLLMLIPAEILLILHLRARRKVDRPLGAAFEPMLLASD